MFDKKGLVNRLLVLFQRRVLLLNTNKKRAFFVFLYVLRMAITHLYFS